MKWKSIDDPLQKFWNKSSSFSTKIHLKKSTMCYIKNQNYSIKEILKGILVIAIAFHEWKK